MDEMKLQIMDNLNRWILVEQTKVNRANERSSTASVGVSEDVETCMSRVEQLRRIREELEALF